MIKFSYIWFYLQKIESRVLKRYLHSNILWSTIHNSQELEAAQMPINRWINKEKYGLYIQWNIIQPSKGRKYWHDITWMNFEDIMLSEISQSQKDKCYIVSSFSSLNSLD